VAGGAGCVVAWCKVRETDTTNLDKPETDRKFQQRKNEKKSAAIMCRFVYSRSKRLNFEKLGN
jgi:hypothetical protein